MTSEATKPGDDDLLGLIVQHGALGDHVHAPLALRAGPLTVLWEDHSLRYIRLGDREIVRRIYCAVRDRNWGTIPNRIVGFRASHGNNSFEMIFDVHNVQGEIDFRWQGKITGADDGTITFEMNGEAHSTFWRNRIGFCVLHPIEGCAGEPCVIVGPDDRSVNGRFPRHIDPENPFREITAIRQELSPGVWTELSFRGDLFEMEDQRNWTDASFKTFCTPLRLPFPVEVRAGERIAQSVTLRIVCDETVASDWNAKEERGDGDSPSASSRPVTLTLGEDPVGPLPQIGLGWTPRQQAPDEAANAATSHSAAVRLARERFRHAQLPEVKRLRDLSLSHLRCELSLDDADCVDMLSEAGEDAGRLGLPLELVLHVSDNAEAELSALVRHPVARPGVVRCLIFHKDHWSTPWRLIETARRILAKWDPRIPVGGGSRANFLELNRNRPPAGSTDFVAWPVDPQEHAFDDTSLFETVAAQRDTVESARQFAIGRPLVVGPITFKRRVNPYAKGPPEEVRDDQLPPRVDCRQLSLFGAAWTLGSLKYLAEAGAAAVTYFETLGWLGVMEHEAGSPLPALFPSIPGAVFPLYFVLADAGEMKTGKVAPVRSSDPLRVEVLFLQSADEEQRRLMIANPTAQVQPVTFATKASRALLRILDETNVLAAMRDPSAFRSSNTEQAISGRVDVDLPPYSYTCLDLY